MSVRRLAAAGLALLTLTGGVAVAAGPPPDRVVPPAEYTTEKARRLGATHARALQELSADIYHCMPWVDVQKGWIGFLRPRGAQQDDRYLSVHIYIEQDPSPAFGKMPFEHRAAAMFSRYTPPLVRRMTRDAGIAADPALDGFTLILEWRKQVASVGGRPVREQIAIFMDRASILEYLAGRADVVTLASRARVLGFDGETALGMVKLGQTFDDNFTSTYKVANYQLEPGIVCQ